MVYSVQNAVISGFKYAVLLESVYFDSASLASLSSDDDAIWFDAVDDWSVLVLGNDFRIKFRRFIEVLSKFY